MVGVSHWDKSHLETMASCHDSNFFGIVVSDQKIATYRLTKRKNGFVVNITMSIQAPTGFFPPGRVRGIYKEDCIEDRRKFLYNFQSICPTKVDAFRNKIKISESPS